MSTDLLQESIAYLKKAGSNGKSLYDHLSDVLVKILEQKPDNAYSLFENLSTSVKQSGLNFEHSGGASGVVHAESPVPTTKDAPTALSLFTVTDEEEHDEVEVSNLLEEATALEWAGVGLTKEETFRLTLSMRKLTDRHPLKSVRFFGKILGLHNDYYVVESEFRDGEGEEDQDTVHMQIPPPKPKSPREDEDSESEESANKEKEQAPAVPQAPVIPPEEFAGANKYTYWVCKKIGEDWVRLPSTTPAQIVAARNITKYLTGNLDAPVKSYPPFPGLEKHYLRVQIARISAATIISPKGYFVNEEEEEEAGEDEEILLTTDPDFAGHAPSALLDLTNWVHHHDYILPQGRCTYFRPPKQRKEGEEENEEEEEEEEEEEGEDETPAESGPRLLTEISEDKAIGSAPAWTVRLGSQFNKRNPVAFARSTAWPGAVCVSWGPSVCQKFANIYVGYATKYTGEPFTPLPPPLPAREGVDMIEATDPTAEDEKELERQKEAERKQNEQAEEGEEGEEAEEGEEGEEDEDYEDE